MVYNVKRGKLSGDRPLIFIVYLKRERLNSVLVYRFP